MTNTWTFKQVLNDVKTGAFELQAAPLSIRKVNDTSASFFFAGRSYMIAQRTTSVSVRPRKRKVHLRGLLSIKYILNDTQSSCFGCFRALGCPVENPEPSCFGLRVERFLLSAWLRPRQGM